MEISFMKDPTTYTSQHRVANHQRQTTHKTNTNHNRTISTRSTTEKIQKKTNHHERSYNIHITMHKQYECHAQAKMGHIQISQHMRAKHQAMEWTVDK